MFDDTDYEKENSSNVERLPDNVIPFRTSSSQEDVNDTAFDYEPDFEEEKKISAYYYYRRIKKNKLERKARQNQLWFNRFRVLFRLVFLIFLIFFGYKLFNMRMWFLDPNIFSNANNKSLEIVNNKIVPNNKILAVLRNTKLPHVPIYRLETYDIKQNVMHLDPVENVYIRRFWFPARLQIIVFEKKPVITISPAENVAPIAFFADDGTLIGREYLPLSPQFKTILVLSYGTKGDDYRTWNIEKIHRLEKLARTVKNYSKEDLSYIDLRNPRDVYVKIPSVNIRLGTLDDTAIDRMKRISSILPQVKLLDKPIKYVDLRWANTNYIKLDS